MTNYVELVKTHIEEYNKEYKTDFSFGQILPDEVIFVEITTTQNNDTIFDFSIKFGIKSAKLSVEGCL